MKKEELLATLSTIAQEYWDAHQLPVLLSQLPKELEQRSQADYKSLLDSGSLKSFIKETQASQGRHRSDRSGIRVFNKCQPPTR